MKTSWIRRTALTAVLTGCFGAAFAAEEVIQGDVGTANAETLGKVHASKPSYSPYVGRNFPTRPLFGDQHLHTAFSMDAGAFGCRLTPKDAYRLARGEEITSSSG
jgi:hypothetical protein